jgi:toxin YhaV
VRRPARPIASAVVVNGWTLLFWISFRERWDAIRDAAAHARARDPEGYRGAPAVKLLRTVSDLVFKDIPANPDHPRFRQGKTLGSAHAHWRRAKFHQRFRLFFRFHSASRVIIYAWLNDENTLRKAGSHTDPYAVFRRMLEREAPPSDWEALMRKCETASADEPGD